MTEGKELPVTESPREIEQITSEGWERIGRGGTGHSTYVKKPDPDNKLGWQYVRVSDKYKDGDILEKELEVLRAGLVCLTTEEEPYNPIRKVYFDEKPAILSPGFGSTLPSLWDQLKSLERELLLGIFKRMQEDALVMAGKGVCKTLRRNFHTDEHIVCCVVEGELRFGFLDPNVDELEFSEDKEMCREMMRGAVVLLAREYLRGPLVKETDIDNAKDIQLGDLEGLSLLRLNQPASLKDDAEL